MADVGRIRGFYGGPVGRKLDIPVTKELLNKLGACMVDSFIKEAKKDFAKRAWTGEARDGSAPIWDSFSYQIRGDRTVEILSTFPDLEALTKGKTPPRKMTWLTQEAKRAYPSKYPLTPRERKAGRKLPLVVPLKGKGGVVFRMAPLKMADAWIHPGIARFTFIQRAARGGRAACIKVIAKEALKVLKAEFSG